MERVLRNVAALILSSLCAILFLAIIVPFYLLRQIVQVLAVYLRPDFLEVVSRRSSVWTADSIYTSPECNITIITVFDNKISHSLLRQDLISNVLTKYARFKQHFEIWCGYSFWKLDEAFDIDSHLIQASQVVIGQQNLINLANKISRRSWTKGSSPWSMLLVQNYQVREEAQPTSAVIFNVHHSLSDAFGAQCVLMSLVGAKPPLRPTNDITAGVDMGSETMTSAILKYADSIYLLMKDLVTLKDYNDLRRHVGINKERDISYISTVVDNEVNVSIPFHRVQNIQDEFKVSTTAVMAALAGSCIESICAQAKFQVPESVHLMLPYSIPEHSRRATNHQSFVFLNVPVKGQTMPKRLLAIEADIRRQRKGRFSIIFQNVVPLLLGPLPTFLVKHLYKVDLSTGMLISIKIDEAIAFRGSNVTDISFISGPLPGDQGIFFFFMKYEQKFKIGMALNSSFRNKIQLQLLLENMANQV